VELRKKGEGKIGRGKKKGWRRTGGEGRIRERRRKGRDDVFPLLIRLSPER